MTFRGEGSSLEAPTLDDEEQEVSESGPSEADIEACAANLVESPDFEAAVREIELLAEGQGSPSIHREMYPGWTQENFQDLLARLERVEK